MAKTYIRTETNGHMYFSKNIGELLDTVQVTETWDNKQYQVASIIIKTDKSIFTLPIKSPRKDTTIEIITEQERKITLEYSDMTEEELNRRIKELSRED